MTIEGLVGVAAAWQRRWRAFSCCGWFCSSPAIAHKLATWLPLVPLPVHPLPRIAMVVPIRVHVLGRPRAQSLSTSTRGGSIPARRYVSLTASCLTDESSIGFARYCNHQEHRAACQRTSRSDREPCHWLQSTLDRFKTWVQRKLPLRVWLPASKRAEELVSDVVQPSAVSPQEE
jgi:hypothetical protein